MQLSDLTTIYSCIITNLPTTFSGWCSKLHRHEKILCYMMTHDQIGFSEELIR